MYAPSSFAARVSKAARDMNEVLAPRQAPQQPQLPQRMAAQISPSAAPPGAASLIPRATPRSFQQQAPGLQQMRQMQQMQQMRQMQQMQQMRQMQQTPPTQSFSRGGGAWTRKEGQNPEGGLNEKGRASLRAQGQDIKRPVSAKQAKKSPKAAARRKSFCARMSGMPGPMKDDKGRPTRKALSLRKWDC